MWLEVERGFGSSAEELAIEVSGSSVNVDEIVGIVGAKSTTTLSAIICSCVTNRHEPGVEVGVLLSMEGVGVSRGVSGENGRRNVVSKCECDSHATSIWSGLNVIVVQVASR